MPSKKVFRILGSISLLVAVSLACNFFSNTQRNLQGVQKTAEKVGTDVQSGKGLISTGQAIATQVLNNKTVQTVQAVITQQGPSLAATIEAFATQQGPEIAQTLQAVATQQGPSLLATAQAFATQQGPEIAQTLQALVTQQGPSLLATAQAFTTQQGPEIAQTLQAVATQQGPSLQATTQALATRISATQGPPPTDIPEFQGPKQTLFSSPGVISYTTQQTLSSIKEFYEKNMPPNGWTRIENQSVISDNAVVLVYEKAGRRATIALDFNPAAQFTTALIEIQAK